MMQKYIFAHAPKTKVQFDQYFQLYKRNWNEQFLATVGDECDKQWDRIVNRRASAWFYAFILNVLVAFVVGVAVGKLLL